MTPLDAACFNKQAKISQLLLTHLDQSKTCFIWACAQGKFQKVKTLLKSKSIDFNATDDDGRTGFYHACRHGHFQTVKLLVEQSHDLGLDLDKADKGGMTPFHTACYNKHDKIVEFLINFAPKGNINLKDNIGQSGLQLYFLKVCENGDVKNLEKLLKLEEKIDFNEPDKHGQTGLFWACWKGHFHVVKLLVEQSQDLGLDLNKAEKGGMTPFHTACFNQQAKVVHFLMESEDKYGINLSLVDQNGFTGFGYLTKKCDLKSETESPPHPNLTKDIEGGQEFNPRYVLFTNISRFLFTKTLIFLVPQWEKSGHMSSLPSDCS